MIGPYERAFSGDFAQALNWDLPESLRLALKLEKSWKNPHALKQAPRI